MKSIPTRTHFSSDSGEPCACTRGARTTPPSARPPPASLMARLISSCIPRLPAGLGVSGRGGQDPACPRAQSWEKGGLDSPLSSEQGHVQEPGLRGGVWVSASLQVALGKKFGSVFRAGCHQAVWPMTQLWKPLQNGFVVSLHFNCIFVYHLDDFGSILEKKISGSDS